ncbi:unnamed protein product, partial [Medioppia subpectinata]
EFTILESGNVVCVGKVRTSDEYTLSLQHVLVDTEANLDKEVEVNLTTADLYKDLKILGYDYGPKFRRIKTMRTNDFEKINGQISWDGNWVTFMDSLLQTMAAGMPFRKMMVPEPSVRSKGSFSWDGNWVTFMDSLLQTMAAGMPFRKMMVPVMIRSLRCDPKALYEGIAAHKLEERSGDILGNVIDDKNLDNIDQSGGEKTFDESEVEGILSTNSVDYMEELFGKEFHVYPSVLPYYVDMNSRMIVTYGVEIENLMAFPIARKSNMQDLKLESYQFVANEENIAIEESEKQSVKEYLKICSLIGDKIKELNESKDKKVIPNISDD